MLAAREEVLLDQLALAAALAAVVAAALLLRLQSGGALDVGDLVDVLLLARAAHGHLIVTLLVGRAGAATSRVRRDDGLAGSSCCAADWLLSDSPLPRLSSARF